MRANRFDAASQPRESFCRATSRRWENLLGARSLDKAIEVQTEYARAAYEGYVSQAIKLSRLYADLGKEAFKSYQDFAAKVTPVK